MLDKIRSKIVFNRANRLNKRGEGLVQIELRQKGHLCYFSTNVYILPESFKNGLVVQHPNANALNAALMKMKNEIEAIELNFFLNNITPTLAMMKTAVKECIAPSAKLVDFGNSALKHSDKKPQTIEGYKTLFNNIEKFKQNTLLNEVDYDFIVKYDSWLKQSGVAHNTRVGRLRQLKAILNEAVRREVIHKNPFDNFKIPPMINKKGYINEYQLQMIERINDDECNPYVRDAFLFCCYCGLRISDLLSLKSEHITHDGWIHKKMIKTNLDVHIPIGKVFGGKALDIIAKYKRIERLTKQLRKNNEINRDLKIIYEKVGIPKEYTFHTSRHTFATLLLNQGVAITSVQKMLGHTKVSTTQIYSEISQETIEKDLLRTFGDTYK